MAYGVRRALSVVDLNVVVDEPSWKRKITSWRSTMNTECEGQMTLTNIQTLGRR